MDTPVAVGCLVSGRLVGAIEAEQTEDGETVRNDRLIAVSSASPEHRDVHGLDDLSKIVLDEIEHFFASYNDFKGKTFNAVGRCGPDAARQLVERARTGQRT
jgi:inorganic pyrophosphatase